MCTHWLPWPGNTNTAPRCWPALATVTSLCGRSSESASSALHACTASLARTAARTSRWVRARAAVRKTSGHRASGLRCNQALQRAACARSAGPLLADNSSGTPKQELFACSGSGRADFVAASSMTTCALVPLKPKPETPMRLGRLGSRGQGCASVSSESPLPCQSTCSVGIFACRLIGSRSCCNASTALITPSTPAAADVWPRFDFDEPTHSGRPALRVGPKTAASAPASIGSPRGVPVPWASTASMSAGRSPAARSAFPITRCWLGPFGADKP